MSGHRRSAQPDLNIITVHFQTVIFRAPSPGLEPDIRMNPNPKSHHCVVQPNHVLIINIKPNRPQFHFEVRGSLGALGEGEHRCGSNHEVVCAKDGVADVTSAVEDCNMYLVMDDAPLLVGVQNGDGDVEVGCERTGGEIEVGDFEARDGEFRKAGVVDCAHGDGDEDADDEEEGEDPDEDVDVRVFGTAVGVSVWEFSIAGIACCSHRMNKNCG
ncbi:uncharacterized protein A4U43_C05F11510 [Asparagus officinalis]|uniref:Uncharacterized protein n=1 Tax=Asparagus officinalis TaxID=4686 RepID=A0A5P1EUP2_ASPOF|nr:uncharacterized protein A4U43_C05F11510 [Asparagus officinalis]